MTVSLVVLQLGGWSEQAPPTMEAGGADREEETLQTAFKKLRVDAESLPGCVPEAQTTRAPTRVCLDGAGAKTKLSCSKDNWHCCTRKSSRGASRTQRRRRSKSPILHPPRFTYSVASSLLAAPGGSGLKPPRLVVSEPGEGRAVVQDGAAASASGRAQTEPFPVDTPSLQFDYDERLGGVASSSAVREVPAVVTGAPLGEVRPTEGAVPERSGAEPGAAARWGSGAADFRALSELHRSADAAHGRCSCTHSAPPEPQGAGPGCGCPSWRGVEVYSFSGLRGAISECERSLDAAAAPSDSPRSCSEQARAHVDDVTIEDLSGYMEFYLYIPKKMSHMAEMMYT